jgi:hypothetical protein
VRFTYFLMSQYGYEEGTMRAHENQHSTERLVLETMKPHYVGNRTRKGEERIRLAQDGYR